jgi:hypothetical protein
MGVLLRSGHGNQLKNLFPCLKKKGTWQPYLSRDHSLTSELRSPSMVSAVYLLKRLSVFFLIILELASGVLAPNPFHSG